MRVSIIRFIAGFTSTEINAHTVGTNRARSGIAGQSLKKPLFDGAMRQALSAPWSSRGKVLPSSGNGRSGGLINR
jgi:hypothetical protein